MDLQSILDASDSDDSRSESSHVDIERILREEDDGSGEDRLDMTVVSMSTIETNALHFPKKQQRYRLESDDKESKEWMSMMDDPGVHSQIGSPISKGSGGLGSNMKYPANSQHNAEEWAVLQQILGEEDDEVWVETTNTNSSRKPADVDDILQSINSEEEDDEFQESFVTKMGYSQTQEFMMHTAPPIIPEAPQQWSQGPFSDEYPMPEMSRGLFVEDVAITSTMSMDEHDMTQTRATTSNEVFDDEVASEKALEFAINYEKKLLRPGHREIVSPLMVKRRLKPRIELESSMQLKQRQAQGNINKSDTRLPPQTPRFGFSGVLEDKAMASVSQQLLKNVQEKKNKIGLPTALCINSKFIAIGTQKGVVQVFDLFEVLRQQLGGHHSSNGDGGVNVALFGAVTSIDVSGNGEALIAGYSTGVLVLWDIIKGVVLKNMSDVHPSPVTVVRFLNEKEMKVVSVDSGGLVHKLTFSKNILWSAYSLDSDCLLDGTAGQILAMNILAPPPTTGKTPQSPFINRLILIALSSERSSFVVAVEPSINVLNRWAKPSPDEICPPKLSLPSDYTSLPCLSWGWSLALGGGNVLTPILARAWGCKLQFLRASFQDNSSDESNGFQWPAFGLHDEFSTEAPIVALEWLGERSLAYLTMNNEFTIVDTVMMTMLERLNFSDLQLIYAEFTLSRNAPKEFESARSKKRVCTTFQNTMRSSDSRLLVLCQHEVRSISIQGAKQRISALEEDGEWLEALALALDHYENTVKSQEDRQRGHGKDFTKHPEFYSVTRTEDEEWIAKLLMRYFNLAVDNAPDADQYSNLSPKSGNVISRLDLSRSHFQMLAGVCVEFCVLVRRLDLLFGPIFRRFFDVDRTSVFLDVLEPYVLNDKLNYIAPEAMSHFVEHCKATNGIAVVERCLLHMDVTIMDFDSIISLLRRNEMFSALIHVFTHGLDDFVTPLEIILERLFDLADAGEPIEKRRINGIPQSKFEKFGYKTILYLQHCFRGKTFPQEADLEPEDKLSTIRPLLLRFLQQQRHNPSGNFKREVEVSLDPVGHRALVYPYTKVLLMVDARAVLDTISLALDAPDSDFTHGESGFESIGGWEVEVGAEAGSISRDSDSVEQKTQPTGPDRQQIISMLSSIILPDEGEKQPFEIVDFTRDKHAVNAFLDFMARYLTKGVVRANKTVTHLIISRIADRFRASYTPLDRQLAQREIIELLTALPRNAYDPDHALRMIKEAGIHRAALLLHQQGAAAWHEGGENQEGRSHHFRCAVDCYLEDIDPDFRTEVFEYALHECTGANTADDSDATKLKDALLSKLAELVNLDAVLSAQLVAELYIDQIDDVVSFLGKGDDVSRFMLLHAIISGDLGKIDVVAGSVLSANLSMDHHQIYLSLMAKLHPDMVYDYLSTHDNYRPEECLKLCKEYDIADASAYLLERMGNVTSALQLILQTFETRMMGLKRTVRGFGVSFFSNSSSTRRFLVNTKKLDPVVAEQEQKQKKEVEGVKRILIVALDMCDRNSGAEAANPQQGSQHWFNVLDRLINAKGFLRLSKEQPAHAGIITVVLGDLLQLTMQRMVSSVPLSDLVRKVTTDNAGGRLGELREMVMSLLRTYGHETNVFSGAVKVMQHDLKQMEAAYKSSKLAGAPVRNIQHHSVEEHRQVAIAGSYVSTSNTLVVGVNGHASFGEKGRVMQANASNRGLATALDRLNSRRKPSLDRLEESQPGSKKAATQLPMLSETELLFYKGESLEAYDERYVGELGEAQSYGSLHWIQSA